MEGGGRGRGGERGGGGRWGGFEGRGEGVDGCWWVVMWVV